MTRILIALSLALPFALSAGCKSTTADSAEMVLCADCGMEKGSEDCCEPDAPRCDKCGMIKGAPGCCK